jgi:flagellar FliL protein
MSDEDERENDRVEPDGAEAEEDGGSGAKKIIFLVVVPLLLLVGVGGGLYLTGALDGILGKKPACVEELDEEGNVLVECEEEPAAQEPAKTAGESGGATNSTGAAFLEIPTMIVNLRADDSTPRYLRLTVQLELAKASDVAAVEAVIPRVVDQFQTYLRELRVRDLRGSAGIYRLQMELLWRVNQAAAPVQVKDVLFQEILIQ